MRQTIIRVMLHNKKLRFVHCLKVGVRQGNRIAIFKTMKAHNCTPAALAVANAAKGAAEVCLDAAAYAAETHTEVLAPFAHSVATSVSGVIYFFYHGEGSGMV